MVLITVDGSVAVSVEVNPRLASVKELLKEDLVVSLTKVASALLGPNVPVSLAVVFSVTSSRMPSPVVVFNVVELSATFPLVATLLSCVGLASTLDE